MKSKIFKLALCVFLSLSVVLLSGCERMRDMGMTDEIVAPPDTDTMPTLKVGVIRPYPNYFSFGEGAELAQIEINQAGGVLGMPIEFVYKEELTEDVVQSATDLIEDENVVAILGPLFSSHAVKVGPIATVPVLLGATGANVTETIEAAQSTDPIAIRDAIAAITDYEGATSISHFDENRHPVKSVGVFQIVDGQTRPYKVIGTETAFEISGAE